MSFSYGKTHTMPFEEADMYTTPFIPKRHTIYT